MRLWIMWFNCLNQLRSACSRYRTFLWMSVVLMAMCIRCGDCVGVTSIVRIIGLSPYCYDRLLDFFHSPSLNLELLVMLWAKLVLKLFQKHLVIINGRYVLLADGIKVSKEGKKMPAVKRLHQESDSNTKPEYIMGHSCQAAAILVRARDSFFAVPLISQIHEGLVFSNHSMRTLYNKLLTMLDQLQLPSSYYLVADAYYSVAKMVNGLIVNNNHLITRVKKNAVAYLPVNETSSKRQRGRPKKYGKKVKLKTLFDERSKFSEERSPIYGEKNTIILVREMDLLWRQAGVLVKFVLVVHPHRGTIMLMTTDLDLAAIEVIKLYALRFKIEVSFKQSLHTIGAYTYHFWMKKLKPIKRNSGDQYLHRESKEYRDGVKRKMMAYHRHIQLGLIAQGLLQFLSVTQASLVWKQFGSWIRTIRPGVSPSEQVTAMALKNSLPDFLMNKSIDTNLKKFLYEKIDISRAEGMRLVA